MKIVHLDYGHGGHDPGAVGNGLKEKDIVLSVGNKVTAILKNHGVKVTHSRTTDVFVELRDRAQMANKAKADILASLHCNSYSDPNAQGVETFSYPGSGAGKLLAKSVQDNIIKDKLYTKDRGIKTANFAVLRHTQMPACLVELGFISNKEDAAILKNKQDELASAVAKGLLNNLGVAYKPVGAVDKVYNDAVDTLVKHKVIGSPGAWQDASKIKASSARSLVIKTADYINQGM
ncbi:MAG: N-acetylmuramoyl-L-alanine amidase [Epulopiscium sp.]|nr:N-acetylmuramoyl-L-alanine amidase [Candidatus Epulonipiscium sp.]